MMLAPEHRRALLALARKAVQAAASARDHVLPPAPAGLEDPAGAFVSLHDAAGGLRGCIGYVEARRALWQTVWSAASGAAAQDSRFSPVTSAEVASLSIEISVLSEPRRARAEDVQVGEHGVIVSEGPRRGLLLPQVASDRGWDAEEFLEACCDKAGLPPGAWRNGATLEVFTAEVFHE
jgi:AmmeMemoRadiSam system protein A